MSTKVWACCGASAYAPENTIPAFRLAIEQGADGIELDVQLSRDGKLMVIRDFRVDRTGNGTGRVVDMTCQDLKRLDFSAGMDGFGAVRIPTLKEVYGLLRNNDLTINVDVKYGEVEYPGIWDKLIQLEREMGMQGRVIYSSANHYVLRKIRELDPDAAISLVYDCALVDPWIYAGYLQADAIQPDYRVALGSPGLWEGCESAGVAVNAYGADDPAAVQLLSQTGASAVITADPKMALLALGRYPEDQQQQ